MEDFFDRLDSFINEKGLNDNQVTVQAGLSVGALGKQRKGSRGLSSDSIAKLLHTYPDLDPSWLLTGKRTKDQYSTSSPINNYVDDNSTHYLKDGMIPFVSIAAVAGFGNADFAIQKSDVKDYYLVPKFKDRKIDFMIEVSGSSMYPKYSPGDVVACTVLRESHFIQWNKVHVIGTAEQGILIKRVKKGSEADRLLLISDNKDYDPFEIDLKEVTGMALVVGVIRLE